MAPTPRLLDQWGKPVSLTSLTQEFAEPTRASINSVWTESVATAMDPIALGEILRQAARGYPDRFFVLAEEMEERDLHYGSVLGTRKLAITGIEPIVVEGGKDATAKRIAEVVGELVAEPEFVDDMIADLLDALGKGYSLVETVWQRSASEWWPKAYKWRDQRFFQLDQVDGRTLRKKSPGSADGLDLPPFLFAIHRPKRKSGLPIRGGLARLAAWAFLFKHYSLKDWMAFLEVYGMPLRVGRFGRGASHDDRRVLLKAVRDISTDAAAIIPKEMEIEFIEAKGGGSGSGNGLFSGMAEYLDKQMSKAVLGQTMSTDDGASLSQAKIHENVRHDIARADARQVAVAVNRDLIRPFVDLNFGPQERYPTVVIPVIENEDVKALAEIVSTLVPLGMEIGMASLRERLGFEDPDEGDVLLKPAASSKPKLPNKPGAENDNLDDDEGSQDNKAAARRLSACPHCGGHHALAAEQLRDQDELDLLVEEALSHWQRDMDPMMEPLRQLVARSASYEELLAGLEQLRTGSSGELVAARIAELLMKARGLGDIAQGRS
jgi:phage gp29-like protein